jgi:pimeloyl-ACP methyl ester carboxylesterase
VTDPNYFPRTDGVRLAYHLRSGAGPTLVFLPGYMSDMQGSKALALDDWAAARGLAFLRFDYAGCGASDGAFEAQTLTSWRDDALLMMDTLTSGPLVLIGSSMGGWLMLLVALARSHRIAGLVGIAAAPDFTVWAYSDAEKQIISTNGRLEQPSAYGPEPTVTTRDFFESGNANILLHADIALTIPVRLLHGQADADVPWENSLTLAARLRSADVQVTLIKDGDHRLSRAQDMDLMLAAVESLIVPS